MPPIRDHKSVPRRGTRPWGRTMKTPIISAFLTFIWSTAMAEPLKFDGPEGAEPAGWLLSQTGRGKAKWSLGTDASAPTATLKTVNGRRSALDIVGRKGGYGVNVPVPPGQWHTLRVSVSGKRFAVTFNGKPRFEVEDATFTEAGMVGL